MIVCNITDDNFKTIYHKSIVSWDGYNPQIIQGAGGSLTCFFLRPATQDPNYPMNLPDRLSAASMGRVMGYWSGGGWYKKIILRPDLLFPYNYEDGGHIFMKDFKVVSRELSLPTGSSNFTYTSGIYIYYVDKDDPEGIFVLKSAFSSINTSYWWDMGKITNEKLENIELPPL